MATAAAHRSILQANHQDLAPTRQNRCQFLGDADYQYLKKAAVRAIWEACQMHTSILEASFGLIGAESMMGNFEHALLHLDFVVKYKWARDMNSVYLDWMQMADIKAAVGRLKQPRFALRPDPPSPLAKRLMPDWNSPMARLACRFDDIPEEWSLSQQLRSLLDEAREVCYICEFNTHAGEGLAPSEYDALRNRTLRLEFSLLSYAYNIFPGRTPDPLDELPSWAQEELSLPPLEAMTRLAVLGLISREITIALPAAGIGRALTTYQRRATQSLPPLSCAFPPAVLELLMWTAFLFTQCARQQREEPFFLGFLSDVAGRRGWRSPNDWDAIETAMHGFLYIPPLQSEPWSKIWRRACLES